MLSLFIALSWNLVLYIALFDESFLLLHLFQSSINNSSGSGAGGVKISGSLGRQVAGASKDHLQVIWFILPLKVQVNISRAVARPQKWKRRNLLAYPEYPHGHCVFLHSRMFAFLPQNQRRRPTPLPQPGYGPDFVSLTLPIVTSHLSYVRL